jgi:hypothetical protein
MVGHRAKARSLIRVTPETSDEHKTYKWHPDTTIIGALFSHSRRLRSE